MHEKRKELQSKQKYGNGSHDESMEENEDDEDEESLDTLKIIRN
jgi:hypothetical protein